MTGLYPHLNLSVWPFTVVPDREHCTYLAGRPKLKEDIDQLVRALGRRDTSSIHVMWSWLGAGKTHSLFYMANEAERFVVPGVTMRLLPVYTEFPKGVRSFADVYRLMVAGLDLAYLTDAYLEVMTSKEGDDFRNSLSISSPDLESTLHALVTGDNASRNIARRWLKADKLPIGEFRSIGVAERIASTEAATTTLATLVRIMDRAENLRGNRGLRSIWILDEFQRLKPSGRAVVEDVNAGLHSAFNALPTAFTLVLSFTGAPDAQRLPEWFSPELRDRIGATKVMVLPPLATDQALSLVKEVLAECRIETEGDRQGFFPFNEASCKQIIETVAKHGELRPRPLMQALSAVLESAEAAIEKRELRLITKDVAAQALREYVFVADEED